MNTRVDYDDLTSAFEWVSAGRAQLIDSAAYVDRVTGRVHWVGEGIDEEPPEDLDDAARYVAVPVKNDFDLGSSLALQFAAEHLPASYDDVRDCFRKRGAYSRFKALLEREGRLDGWRRYEQQAVDDALQEWCEDKGLLLVRPAQSRDGAAEP